MKPIEELDIKEYGIMSGLGKKGGRTEALDKMMNKLDEVIERVNRLSWILDNIAERIRHETEDE